jgi:hypothetical protein
VALASIYILCAGAVPPDNTKLHCLTVQDKEQMSGFVLDAESCKQQPDGTPLIEVCVA